MWLRNRPKPAPDPKPYYDTLPTFRPADTAGMLEAMHTDGFALMPGVLTADQCKDARAAADRLTPIHWDITRGVEHYKNVFNRDPFWVDLLDPPGVIDLATAALGDNCHVIGQTVWRCPPGFRGVGVHLDYLPMELPETLLDGGYRVPMFISTAHFFLCDITQDLCPTYVVPGSHKSGRKPGQLEYHWRGRSPQPVLCKEGDVLFFRSDLWHAGSDNTSARTRYLLQNHYARREMAQHFSPYLEWRFDPAILARCTPQQLRLLGDHRRGAYD